MNLDCNILFICGLFTKEKEKEIFDNSKKNIQVAANVLQWKFVNGMDACSKLPISILNAPYIDEWPYGYKDFIYKGHSFKHVNNAKDLEVSFVNLPLIKHFSKYISLKKPIKEWMTPADCLVKKQNIIIGYAMTNTIIRAMKFAKRINPNVKTTLIVPDLPEYMNTSQKKFFVFSLLKKIDIKYIEKNLKYIDSFVFLTEQMAGYLNIQKNYTVIEGIADDFNKSSHSEDKIQNKKNCYKTIFYAGTLNKRYGIVSLLDAFSLIKSSDYRLVICGTGDSESEVIDACQKDSRVIYKGLVDRSKIAELQASSTILINPRPNSEQFTKYSFPSKIMDYMSSGTPLVAYKLDGIPNEYDPFIYYISGSSIEDLKAAIVEACEKSDEELYQFGQRARKFVLENKNAKAQCEKIFKMLSQI